MTTSHGRPNNFFPINYQIGLDNRDSLGLFWGAAVSHVGLPLNVWTHIAGTFDGITFRLYMNGGLLASGNGTGGPTNTAPLRIGTSGDCEKFVGLIDEVELFNRALSDSEIQAIVNAGSAGKCKGTSTPTPTPSSTATATATATSTATPTATPRIAPTPRSRPTPTPRPL